MMRHRELRHHTRLWVAGRSRKERALIFGTIFFAFELLCSVIAALVNGSSLPRSVLIAAVASLVGAAVAAGLIYALDRETV
jgi:peptidoglycan/LPS O-acetylase OafA/YrhL